MKTKRILITYLGNGNYESEIAKEVMFNRILNEMIEEGREVSSSVLQPKSKSVLFDDGSKLYCYPIGTLNKGFRVTHMFVDTNIIDAVGGRKLLEENLNINFITDGTKTFDTSGKRLSYFSFCNGRLEIK